MIYLSQGHELGIGVEIYLKALLMLPPHLQKEVIFYIYPQTFEQNCKNLGLKPSRFSHLNFITPSSNQFSQSESSLLSALNKISSKDVLITLPTSKDQLPQAGYTAFFRSFYSQENIVMNFISENLNVLLLTDHIPLSDVSKNISNDLIREKLHHSLLGHKTYFNEISEVLFSGINPHCGEGGLIGLDDQIIENFVNSNKTLGPNLIGPLSGDTLHLHLRSNSQLFCYAFHDQALAFFKSYSHYFGLNVTFGLPFLRLSVDHGTAFELYGKNKANYLSAMYSLRKAFEVLHVY